MDRKTIQEQFGSRAADYVTSKPHAEGASLQRLVTLVQAQPEWKMLDVATGAGHTAFAFAPLVNRVWATDITEQMLAIARQQAQKRGLENIIVDYADADELPYNDDTFDLVTCRIAPHHFADVAPFLREARRVLRPGGILGVVDNIVPEGPAGIYVNAFEKLRDPSHGRCLTMEEWASVFKAAGFKLTHQERLDKQIVFDDWAKRHDPVMVEYLRALLNQAPPEAAAFLQSQTINEHTTFRLQEGLFIGEN
jgi:ubiquinone/menaquinone biosynthesis C-methylase UbiE